MAEKLKRLFKRKGKPKHGHGSHDGESSRSLSNEEDEEVDNFFDDSGHREHMRQMDQMFRDPFGTFGNGGGLLSLEGSPSDRRRQQQQAQNMQVAQHSVFMDPFAHFNSMFTNMHSMMSDMRRGFDTMQNDPNAHVYQQSSFMSYNNTGGGAPQVYQASTSSRQGPGGVKESRKTVRDSETGVERVAIGHHINDRGHVIERSRNTRTGDQNENQEYINLEEEEARPFDQEYQERWRHAIRGVDQRRHLERSRHAPVNDSTHRRRHLALPESRPRRHSSRNQE